MALAFIHSLFITPGVGVYFCCEYHCLSVDDFSVLVKAHKVAIWRRDRQNISPL